MARELDCLLWCPSCRVERGQLFRVPTGSEGVYENVTDPVYLGKQCAQCGTELVRK